MRPPKVNIVLHGTVRAEVSTGEGVHPVVGGAVVLPGIMAGYAHFVYGAQGADPLLLSCKCSEGR
jgi:hypothetical protein